MLVREQNEEQSKRAEYNENKTQQTNKAKVLSILLASKSNHSFSLVFINLILFASTINYQSLQSSKQSLLLRIYCNDNPKVFNYDIHPLCILDHGRILVDSCCRKANARRRRECLQLASCRKRLGCAQCELC